MSFIEKTGFSNDGYTTNELCNLYARNFCRTGTLGITGQGWEIGVSSDRI